MDRLELPDPAVLARRHLALLLVDECLGGRQSNAVCYSLQRSAAGGRLLWYENGGGDEYGLVLDGEGALWWAFDHECPYSPWARDDGAEDWPGMLDGLPEALAAHLPARVVGQPRSISACRWYADGGWRTGDPEVAADEAGWADPQGEAWLTAPLREVETGVSELVGECYERPERLAAGRALALRVDAGEPLTEEVIGALAPQDGTAAMHARARARSGGGMARPRLVVDRRAARTALCRKR